MKCPNCGEKNFIGQVSTSIKYNDGVDRVIKAYYCNNCFTEFVKRKNSILTLKCYEEKIKKNYVPDQEIIKRRNFIKKFKPIILGMYVYTDMQIKDIVDMFGINKKTIYTNLSKRGMSGLRRKKSKEQAEQIKKDFAIELSKAIEEIATTTEMKTEDCIKQAIEILEKEVAKYKPNTADRTSTNTTRVS